MSARWGNTGAASQRERTRSDRMRDLTMFLYSARIEKVRDASADALARDYSLPLPDVRAAYAKAIAGRAAE